MSNPVSNKAREASAPSIMQLGEMRYLFIHCICGARLTVVGVCCNSWGVRGRFTPDDLSSGISEIVTSNCHEDGYVMDAI
jgi:hypothetical protein